MSQGPSIPGAHPSTQTTLREQLTTNPIKLQGWDSGLPPPVLPARFPVLPENATQSSGFAESAVKVGCKVAGEKPVFKNSPQSKKLGRHQCN